MQRSIVDHFLPPSTAMVASTIPFPWDTVEKALVSVLIGVCTWAVTQFFTWLKAKFAPKG